MNVEHAVDSHGEIVDGGCIESGLVGEYAQGRPDDLPGQENEAENPERPAEIRVRGDAGNERQTEQGERHRQGQQNDRLPARDASRFAFFGTQGAPPPAGRYSQTLPGGPLT